MNHVRPSVGQLGQHVKSIWKNDSPPVTLMEKIVCMPIHVHLCMYQLWQTKISLLSDVLTRCILHEWQRSNNSIVLFLIFVYHNTKFNKHTRLMTKWEVKMAWSMNYRHKQNNWLSSIQPYPSNIFTHTRLVLMCHVTEYSPAKLGISEYLIFPNLQNPTRPFGMKIYITCILSFDIICFSKLTVDG